MKQKRSPFFAYRYFIMPINNQTSILHHQGKTKEELAKNIFESIYKENKTSHESRGRRYIFYGIKKHKNELYVIKLAKETTNTLYKEGDIDLEEEKGKTLKFVYVFVDTKRQLCLIERKSTAFQDKKASVNIIRELMADRMRIHDYTVNISPLSSPQKFWDYVKKADQIYEVNLVMNAPNMLFGNEPIREALEDIKGNFNNDEVEFGIRSREGALKIFKKVLGTAIEYIGNVGGKYLLKFSTNGKEETVTNEEHTRKTYITKRKDDNFSDEDLDNIKDKMDIMHRAEEDTNSNNG